jgi:hypothetical protein
LEASKEQRLYIIQGGNDPVVSKVNESKRRDELESVRVFTKGLPKTSQQFVMRDGSHHYFGLVDPTIFLSSTRSRSR